MAEDTNEPIEGLDRNDEASWGDYPIDTLLIRNETRTIHDVIRRIEKKSYIMDPDFQRDFIWKEDKQSKLIESVLMRIPLPVFYLAEDAQGKMIVVDGLQRLTTFHRFVNNELKLKLPKQKNLDKKHFDDLNPKLQNRIEDCNLILYIIDAKVPERARIDIFERVNGGVPLTRQQMRNCLYMGSSTQFLKYEAKTELFISSTGGSLATSTMRDREMINRFCAFELLSFEKYGGDMDDFLATALARLNSAPDHVFQKYSALLATSLRNNRKVFDKHAFRKFDNTSSDSGRNVFNASIWDVMSTGLAHYPENIVEARADKLRAAFSQLLQIDKFNRAVTLGTNQKDRVQDRFLLTKKMFKEVFHD